MTDVEHPQAPAPAATNRARGLVRATFAPVGTRTEIATLYETGGYRLRLPRSRGPFCEAVVVNTGGGMAGGDAARFLVSAAPSAAVTLTTTAAEKIYRGHHADGSAGVTRIDVALDLAAGAALHWLPQETILFDGAKLARTMEVAMASDAVLLVSEILVFGRLAMGERMSSGRLSDRWRIRRGGRLVHVEEVAIAGDVAGLLDRPALGAGARATATVLFVAPTAEGLLDAARAALADHGGDVTCGVSAWNGLLVARAVSPSPERLRAAIVGLTTSVRGLALPRLWS